MDEFASAAAVRKIVVSLAIDVLGLAGCGLIVYGAWLIFPPAGFLAAGAMLACAAWILARRI